MVLEATDGVYCKAVMPLMYNSTKHWNMSNVEPNRNMLASIFNNKQYISRTCCNVISLFQRLFPKGGVLT